MVAALLEASLASPNSLMLFPRSRSDGEADPDLAVASTACRTPSPLP